MASQMRAVVYRVDGVTSFAHLIDMMRYDGMRFPSTTNDGDWMSTVRMLSRRDVGMIDKNDELPCSVSLIKDQCHNWTPTYSRWASFQMRIAGDWKDGRIIN